MRGPSIFSESESTLTSSTAYGKLLLPPIPKSLICKLLVMPTITSENLQSVTVVCQIFL